MSDGLPHPVPDDHEVPDAPRKDLSAAFPGVWFVEQAGDNTNHLLIDGEVPCGNAPGHLLHKCRHDDNPPAEPATSWWRVRNFRNYLLCETCRSVLVNRLGGVDFDEGDYEALADRVDAEDAEEVIIVRDGPGASDEVLRADDWGQYDNRRGRGFVAHTPDDGEVFIEPEEVEFVHAVADDGD